MKWNSEKEKSAVLMLLKQKNKPLKRTWRNFKLKKIAVAAEKQCSITTVCGITEIKGENEFV